MSAEVVLLLWAGSVLGAFIFGMWLADKTIRDYWHEYGFCPACDRFEDGAA